jgi:hypothetical protein
MSHLPKCLQYLRDYAPDAFARVQANPELLAAVPPEALEDDHHPFWESPTVGDVLAPLFTPELDASEPRIVLNGNEVPRVSEFRKLRTAVEAYLESRDVNVLARAVADLDGTKPDDAAQLVEVSRLLADAEVPAPDSEWPADARTNFERWRNQYRSEPDPNEPIAAPPASVLAVMFSWHGGQGSKLYAAASCWHGGHVVKRETAEAARDELELMNDDPAFTDDDAEALRALEAHLNGEEI